jgi:tRNA pseudouridine55 synthase
MEERIVPDLTAENVVNVLKSFEGKYLQTAPAYSAKKYNGERLYKLAREGKIINLPPKEVSIYSIDDVVIEGRKIAFTARVSKGTYIRSLVMDIGYRLGCGATTTELRRLSQGIFSVNAATTVESASWMNVVGLGEAMEFLPGLLLNESESQRVLLGSQIHALNVVGILGKFEKDEIIRIVGSNETLLAIARSERTSSFVQTLRKSDSWERVAKLEKVLGA